MNDRPWGKFFWADWESDEALKQCSLAAQGLWMRMLCICARGEPPGYLSINGQPLDASGVAKSAGVSKDEAEALMAELEQWGVFSRDRKGRIYSRRMVKDLKTTKHAQKIGKKGGNPKLKKPKNSYGVSHDTQTRKSDQDNRLDNIALNGEDKRSRTRVPEARGQTPPKPPSETSSDPPFSGSPDQAVMSEIFEAAGIDETKMVNPGWHTKQAGIVQGWLQAGLDPPTIVQTIRQVREQSGQQPNSLQYFDNAVRQAEPDPYGGEERVNGHPRSFWRETMEFYRQQLGGSDDWDDRRRAWPLKRESPPPGEPGCKVPGDILAEYGYGEAA